MNDDETRGPREIAYDAEIAPLMTQIIDACNRAGIPIVASFELDPVDGDADDPLFCATLLVPPEAHATMRKAAEILAPKRAPVYAFTQTTTADPDGTLRTTIRRVL